MVTWVASPLAILWLTATVAAALGCLVWSRPRRSLAVAAFGVGSLVGVYHLTDIPLPEDISIPQGSVVYDRDGKVIGSYSEVKRVIIDTRELPEHVADAVLAAEDRGFYDHGGVSFTSLVRASLANLRSMTISQGGSTITQQYVKNAILKDGSRTWTRKLREAVLAVKLEDRYTKPQILDFYLNTIYFGRGVYGIETAARAYFGKPARRLTLGEAAFLAGIIRSPEFLQPDEKPAAARARRDQVLRAMAQEGLVSERRALVEISLPLVVPEGVRDRMDRARAAYFLEWIRRGFLETHFGDCLYECGLQIHTTLDLDIQRHAERAVRTALHRKRDPEAALVAMTPEGEVLAFVGGRSTSSALAASGFNFASDYPGRHAGSALKPFTLIAAFERGIASNLVLDGSSPRTVTDRACAGDGRRWHVQNYGGSSYGAVTLSTATALSINTAYAQLAERVGPGAIAEVLTRFGFGRSSSTGAERVVQPLCSLALGALDVTPLEMARAYAGLAAGGMLPTATPVAYVTDQGGDCIAAFVPRAAQRGCTEEVVQVRARVAPSAAVSTVTQLLQDVVQHGTGGRVELPDVVPAGKTGTSQSNTDAWFAGYTDDLAATVWVGYRVTKEGIVPQMRHCRDRRRCRPVHGSDVTGGTIPAEIWEAFMRRALEELARSGSGSDTDGLQPITTAPGGPAGGPGGPGEAGRPDDRGRDGNGDPVETATPATRPPDPSPPPTTWPLPVPLPSPTRGGGGVSPPSWHHWSLLLSDEMPLMAAFSSR